MAGLLRPWSVSLLGNALAWVFYRASARYRNVALKNLRAVYGGEKSEREITAMAKAVFRHFCCGAYEFFRLLAMDPKDVDAMVDVEGVEHLDRVLAAGKGCIAITAHYGNWELMARKMSLRGYKVNVIARDSDDPGMTGLGRKVRESGGYKVFDRDEPMIGVFRALKKNEVLGILPDQNDSGGIFVDFFGRPAATATGPAVLSLRSGAPLMPAFAAQVAPSRYKVFIYPPIEFQPSGDEQKDIHDLTALMTRAIECEIRKNPTQWLWFHDRWKLTKEAPSAAS